MSDFDDDDLDEIREVFLEEAEEHLQAMEEGLCKLWEGVRETELIHGLFRAAHSLKGGAGAFGLDALTGVTHQMETLFDQFRNGQLECTPARVDVLMTARDVLAQLVDAAKDRAPLDDALAQRTTDALRVAGGAEGAPAPGANPPATVTTVATVAGGTTAASSSGIEQAVGGILSLPAGTPSLISPGNPSLLSLDTPSMASPAGAATQAGASGATKKGPDAGQEPAAAGAKRGATSVRVPTVKLDELVNTVGELVITQSSLEELARNLPPDSAMHLREALRVLARQMHDLRWQTLGLRMLPLDSLFKRMPQVVRDTARTVQKNVDFQIRGQELEVDKLVLEKLNDPLVHLLRNAVDHGLEDTAKRIESGKPEKGVITLAARRESGRVIVSVSDDGAGIPTARVLEKARSAGIVSREAELTNEQVHDLIFSPGLSTAAKVTGVSGRGVGLDVVRENVRALGGDITLRSGPSGTTFHISLPLSLEIIDAQLISVCNQTFVVPLASAHGHVAFEQKRVHRLQQGTQGYRLPDGVIPLIDGAKVLAETTRTEAPSVVVILNGRDQRFGLLTDGLIGQQPVVVRSLDANYRAIPGIAGATVLGNGDLALILDAMTLPDLSDPRPDCSPAAA